jgi:hydroxymethylbilane synthase
MMKKTLKLVTRQSKLAIWQAQHVADRLKEIDPALDIELVKVSTKGDEILDRSLAKIGGKGLFLKELQALVLQGEADFAVHSLKDVPAQQPQGLQLVAFTKRLDARDCLVSREGYALENLSQGARIGSSSLRRQVQLKRLRSDLNLMEMRGNIDTRLKKLFDGQCDAIVLAAAGLIRLGLDAHITQYFEPDVFIPAVGQGVLAIECLESNIPLKAILDNLNHDETAHLVCAERALNAKLGGNCQVPLGIYAKTLDKNQLELTALIADPVSDWSLRLSLQGPIENAMQIGEALALKMLEQGAGDVLWRCEQ